MRYFTPGPTQLSPKAHELILEALKSDIPSISHRSKQFCSIYQRADTALRSLMGIPVDFHIYFLGSATEAMERIVQNCSTARSHHFVNGAFSERFFETAKELGRKASSEIAKYGEGFDLAKSVVSGDIELICATQNETSTGTWLAPENLSNLRSKSKDAVIAVDIVSSAPIPSLDWTALDCAFFSVQKCFGLPAGLGVLMVNDRALSRANKIQAEGHSTGSYHNFASLENYAKKFQTPETPNVLGIYLLAGVAEDMLRTGIDKIRNDTKMKADRLYQALSKIAGIKPFVSDTKYRSQTVITGVVEAGSTALVAELAKKGIEVGTGYGSLKDSHIRIANFPMHNMNDIEDLISNLEHRL